MRDLTLQPTLTIAQGSGSHICTRNKNAVIALHLQLILPLSDGSAFLSQSECKKFTWVENNAQLIHGKEISEGLVNARTALLEV